MEEQRCIGSLGMWGYAPQTVQNQINPAQNTGKREKEQGERVLLVMILSLVI